MLTLTHEIDSTINNVPIGILTNGNKTASPNIVIDNTIFNNVPAIVQVSGGSALLSGKPTYAHSVQAKHMRTSLKAEIF